MIECTRSGPGVHCIKTWTKWEVLSDLEHSDITLLAATGPVPPTPWGYVGTLKSGLQNPQNAQPMGHSLVAPPDKPSYQWQICGDIEIQVAFFGLQNPQSPHSLGHKCCVIPPVTLWHLILPPSLWWWWWGSALGMDNLKKQVNVITSCIAWLKKIAAM